MTAVITADDQDKTVSVFEDVYTSYVSMHHTDAAGVVYVASPSQWAQIGMENLFRAAGHPIEELGPAPVHYPMVRLEINHRGKLRLGDALTVRTFVARVGSRSVTVRSEIALASGPVRIVVDLTAVAVGRDGSKPHAENWLRELYEGAEHNGLIVKETKENS